VSEPHPPPAAEPVLPAEDEPVLPRTSRDERDVGWGDEPADLYRDDDWYHRERPPHHE
jgi:hypothetical protein